MAEDLSEVKDVLGEFSTDAGGGDRWQNLKAGSDMLNGKILMPGEEISVYNSTAPYDAEHGYVQAGTYENGEIVADWGGGICQVSTTLYNAVIFAELEIVERYPHSMTVSYVEPSRDAAIAGGIMDFRFKNSYDTPIYIFSEIDDENQLRFIIYGKETRPENRTIEFESETVSIEEYKVTYKENPDMSVGEMEYTGNPHSGRDACLWKIVYEDGVEVSREKFNTSYYMKVDEVIEVGTKGAGGALGAIQSAIGSQDYDKIIAAINSVE
jgi:vancomycin resistance protein YoaR